MSGSASFIGSEMSSEWGRQYEDEDTWYEFSSVYQSGPDTELLPTQDTALSLRMAKYRRVTSSSHGSERAGSVVSGRGSLRGGGSSMKERLDVRDLEKDGASATAASGRSAPKRNIWMLRNLPTTPDSDIGGLKCLRVMHDPTYFNQTVLQRVWRADCELIDLVHADKTYRRASFSAPCQTQITLPGFNYSKWERKVFVDQCNGEEDESGDGVVTLVLVVADNRVDQLLMSPADKGDRQVSSLPDKSSAVKEAGNAQQPPHESSSSVKSILQSSLLAVTNKNSDESSAAKKPSLRRVQPKFLSIVESLTSSVSKASSRPVSKRSSIPTTPTPDDTPLLLSHEQIHHLRVHLVDYQRPKRLWTNLMYGKTAHMSTVSYFSFGMAFGSILALIVRLIIALFQIIID